MKILIIGGGPAAHSAAIAARDASPRAEVAIFTKESIAPYRRPALSRYVKADLPDDQFFLDSPERYRVLNIALHTDAEIQSLDCRNHTVLTADGATEEYDKLVLCNGSSGFIPPLTDAENFPPMLLRSYRDCMAIRRAFQSCRSTVILGGGLLGLELADSLAAMGGDVAVIEANQKLLNKQLSPEASDRFLAIAQESKVRFVLGDTPKRFLTDGVELNSGAICRAGMVCAACGVRPAMALAQTGGIPCGRGITVDEHMQTGMADVFAAGDCVEFQGRLSGFFAPACDMGKVVGTNAAGGDAAFAFAPDQPLYWRGLGVQITDGVVDRA